MTDSNLALMTKLDTLPTASVSSNYQDEEAIDLVTKGVNTQIDENQKQLNAHFDSLIKMYNHLHKRAENRPKEFLQTLKQGKEFKSELQDFQKYWGNYFDYANRLQDQRETIDQVQWAHYPNKGDFDKDVKNEIENQPIISQVRAQSNDFAGQLQREGADEDAHNLYRGPEGSYENEVETIQNLETLLTDHEASYRPRAEAGMKVPMPGQFTADGRQIYKTYGEAVGMEERRYISDVIDSWYAYKHKDLAGGRIGLWKQKFINELLDRDTERVKKELERDGAVYKELQLEGRHRELETRINKDPGFIIDYIDIYKGFHDGRYDLARKEAFDMLIDGINSGALDRADIEPVLNHQFLAHDSTPDNPHWVTPRNYWKKDSARLLSALREQEKTMFEEAKATKETEMNTMAMNILKGIDESDAPLTFKSVQNIQLDFMQKWGIRDPEELPDLIKNLPYEGMYDDQALDAQLSYNHYVLNQRIEPSDLRGIMDPDIKKKWIDIAKSQAGLTKEATTRRNSAISAEVTARTMESDVNKEKTPKWRSNYEQAIIEYDSVYNGVIANGGNDLQAHKEAMEAVNGGLWKEVSPGVYQWDTRGPSGFNTEPARQVNKVVQSIGKDRTLVNSTTPWDGEEPHLIDALNYLEKSRQGREIDQPFYYRDIARKIGMNPERLMINRLEATGAIKPSNRKLPEEENLSPRHQRLLLKPSAAKTYRITQENDDIVWMLDTIASPIAEANGGYDAIRNSRGDYESIEALTGKKLSEVDVGDIAFLMSEGYTNIGRYDFTVQGLVDVLVANQISPDTLFDEDGQNKLLLARLRMKANNANNYQTLDSQYRRLVNIPQKDQDEFLELVGELPTWLKLDTLLPEAAKELVRSTTQQ
jgi:hypothetical protein